MGDLLDLTRLNAGELRLSPEVTAAEDLVGAALQRVSGPLAGREVRASLDPRKPLLLGRFDFVHSLRARRGPGSSVEIAFESPHGDESFTIRGHIAGDSIPGPLALQHVGDRRRGSRADAQEPLTAQASESNRSMNRRRTGRSTCYTPFALGVARRSAGWIGNFWTDLVRGTLCVVLPLSALLALKLVQQGVILRAAVLCREAKRRRGKCGTVIPRHHGGTGQRREKVGRGPPPAAPLWRWRNRGGIERRWEGHAARERGHWEANGQVSQRRRLEWLRTGAAPARRARIWSAAWSTSARRLSSRVTGKLRSA